MYLIRKPNNEEIPQIKETLQSLAKSMRMPANTSTHEIFDRWPDVVGEYLATQSKPLSIQDNLLIVAAANPTVAKELSLNGPSIVNLINGFLKTQVVHKIEVKTGPGYARRFRYLG
ncbi:MAG: DUF721 domain-containing protein [Acidimicrobiaceae bacterium]|nr:DUF721 domain-containing protein [Acidimicrobiaceae bacterium]